jgi:hypothetical protein
MGTRKAGAQPSLLALALLLPFEAECFPAFFQFVLTDFFATLLDD